MTITSTPRWSLGRGNAVVPSRWQATLFAAIAGALLVALIGSARILQLRHTARRR